MEKHLQRPTGLTSLPSTLVLALVFVLVLVGRSLAPGGWALIAHAREGVKLKPRLIKWSRRVTGVRRRGERTYDQEEPRVQGWRFECGHRL